MACPAQIISLVEILKDAETYDNFAAVQEAVLVVTKKGELLERGLEVARHLRLGHYPLVVQSVTEQQMY